MFTNEELWRRASGSLVAGVSAAARLNEALGRPTYFERAKGSRIWDVEGNEYIDMCVSHGASQLGHAHPAITAALEDVLRRGMVNSYDSLLHVEFSEMLTSMVPCAERVRFTNSGSEATMYCVRLARAATGKERVLRFEGHYHGILDFATFGSNPPFENLPDAFPYCLESESAGVPARLSELTMVIPFNDPEILETALRRHGGELAAVICEPVNLNSGCIFPIQGYMELLRRLTAELGIVLIFDEVLSAFRTGPDCAQGYLGITPDLCSIGKCVGGGTPISVFAGRRDLMEQCTPIGRVAHSGTYNGTSPCIAAGLAALRLYRDPTLFQRMGEIAEHLYGGFGEIAHRRGIRMRIQHFGSQFGILFGIEKEITNYRDTETHDIEMMLRFCRETMARGVYFHPYGGKACHHGISTAHTKHDVDQVLSVVDDVLAGF